MKTTIKYISLIALSSILVACGSVGKTKTAEDKAAPVVSTQDSLKAAPKAIPAIPVAAPIPQTGGYSNIDNNQLIQMMKNGVTLIDIRRQDEWEQTGIVKGAKAITFFGKYGRINPNFLPKLKALIKTDQPIALICRTGSRSKTVSQAIVQQLGYKKVYNVSHGIMGWIEEKRPVVAYK